MKSPFRAMRQKLFTEGKLLRYLGYATGEVVLIIVGILFALKISDRNEDRKTRAEFDTYLVQLREDVRDSIASVQESKEVMERFLEMGMLAIPILKISDPKPEDLMIFENGINVLGNYNESQVDSGLLGDLLNGNFEIISRDQRLARKARDIENSVETRLKNAEHIYNQIDLASDRLHQFWGKGSTILEIAPAYDPNFLRSSTEFQNAVMQIIARKGRLIQINERIGEELESFLAVLEDY